MVDMIYGDKPATDPVFGITDVICAVAAWVILLGLSPLVSSIA